jgi:nucleoside-diphosphate-sugar epimerase
LTERLAAERSMLALSRQPTPARPGVVSLQADFASEDGLQLLEGYDVDCLVHLTAALPDPTTSDDTYLAVNTLATLRLLQYLVAHGCRRYLLASSIAATGCLSAEFLPRELPIPDDHPCDATDGYGLSKAMMEQIALYLHRQHPELEVVLFRIGAVVHSDEDVEQDPDLHLSRARLPFLVGGLIGMAEVVHAIGRGVETPLGSGVHRFNLVGVSAPTEAPVVDALRLRLGDDAQRFDLSYYAAPGREFASLYARDRLEAAYGLASTCKPG